MSAENASITQQNPCDHAARILRRGCMIRWCALPKAWLPLTSPIQRNTGDFRYVQSAHDMGQAEVALCQKAAPNVITAGHSMPYVEINFAQPIEGSGWVICAETAICSTLICTRILRHHQASQTPINCKLDMNSNQQVRPILIGYSIQDVPTVAGMPGRSATSLEHCECQQAA